MQHDVLSRLGFHGELIQGDALGSVYKAQTPSGVKVGVRVSGPSTAPGQTALSRAWLRHLERAGIERVPRVLECRDLEDGRSVTVLSWVEGDVAGRDLTADQAYAMGRLTGALHAATRDFQPPSAPSHLRWDANRLFGPGTMSDRENAVHFLSADQRRKLEQAELRVRAAMTRLDPLAEAHGMIHSDLHVGNCVFDRRGQVGAIDFNESAPGYYIWDAAVPLVDFAFDWPSPREDFRSSWLDGYASRRAFLSEEWAELPVFMLARVAEMASWVLDQDETWQTKQAPAFLTRTFEYLEQWLERTRPAR